jgi:aspartate/methionine/tyrosine aminotransferase
MELNMSRLSQGNPALGALSASIYSSYLSRARASGEPYCPLHEGDTYLNPPAGARLFDGSTYNVPGLHKYSPTRGRPELIDAILAQRESKDGTAYNRSQILVTAGVTSGISSAIRALMAPGQSLIALAPFWPLIRGITTSHGVSFIEVPFYDLPHDAASITKALNGVAEEGTAAIYVNWPNNPTGYIPSAEVIDAIAKFACERNLWIFSDEVYEDYVYNGETLPRISSFSGLGDRILRFFSFSKAYAMSGNRVGYVAGQEEVIDALERYTTYAVYSVSGGGQVAAEYAVRNGDAWLKEAQNRYQKIGEEAARILNVAFPKGGAFLFMNAAASLDQRGLNGLLEDLADRGVLATPGSSFGRSYSTWIRICFTCIPPEEVLHGAGIIAHRLGSRPESENNGHPDPKPC